MLCSPFQPNSSEPLTSLFLSSIGILSFTIRCHVRYNYCSESQFSSLVITLPCHLMQISPSLTLYYSSAKAIVKAGPVFDRAGLSSPARLENWAHVSLDGTARVSGKKSRERRGSFSSGSFSNSKS